ncbi:MAG: DNA-directed DNA polymerase II small subunit [Candidatus Marsarchaeota archaeon]|jgi:DNA polymerase II small subunit|nr:DNA-directed DNA polymerase II small subunit [Candidatus Marsarchaeota archaeon]MCL5418878.1 DNA-directed DNA polymerase II small subunit [Candidatus Marsarchaeota archaeon]
MANNKAKELVAQLANAGILVSSDIDISGIGTIDIGLLASKIIEYMKGQQGLKIVDNSLLRLIVDELSVEKVPISTEAEIEVIRKSDFEPAAKDIDAIYSISAQSVEKPDGTVESFVNYFRDRLEQIRHIVEGRSNLVGLLRSIEELKNYMDGREVAIVGMVNSKVVTKAGNVMVILEDETGSARVIFSRYRSGQGSMLESAERIINDEVIAVKGKISGQFVIANEIVWPDVPIKERKPTKEHVAIAFLSDIHVGSKLFMENNFVHFIKWLNGGVEGRKDIAGKIKYIVMNGDVADGIGIYPNQDRDLAIQDVFLQYKKLMELVRIIPEYIHVFILPGNHDAVQRAEPQPQLSAELMGEYKPDNVHMLPSPSTISMHGIDVLAYHGTSLDSIIGALPGMSYASPDKAMIEILKRRHLSPIYGGNIIVPSKHDPMIINSVPDILTMGHIHKNAISNYHGVDIVNSGTWQARTEFQVRQGHIPTPCLLPVYEADKGTFVQIDFNTEI